MKTFKLSRRAVLRGSGVTLGLPLLDAMFARRGLLHATAHAAAAPVPKVLGSFFTPCGAYPPDFFPTAGKAGAGTYTDFTLPSSTAPLTPWKSDCNFFYSHGKYQEMTVGYDFSGDAHAHGTCTSFTGTGLTKNGAAGPTFEQVAADQLWKNATARKSISAALGRTSDKYLSYTSWAAADAPLSPLRSPTALYDFIFPGTGAVTAGDLKKYNRSVLDYVNADAARLKSRLGSGDCARLDQFFTAMREVEQSMTAQTMTCALPDRPADAEELTNERAQTMLRLIVLALQCDISRFFSFQLASRGDNRRFPWLNLGVSGPADQGDPQGHHSISHMTTPEGLKAYGTIARDEVEQFAFLLDLMKKTPHGESNLLDHAAIVFASEHGWLKDNGHSFADIPVVLAGKAGGALKTGQFLWGRSGAYANILVSAMNAVGYSGTSLGVAGKAVIPELMA